MRTDIKGPYKWERVKRKWWESRNAFPIVVSYFTFGYVREAFQLLRSCQVHGLEYSMEKVDDRGTWSANNNYKPTFILQKSGEYPKRALLWLDADARILQRPTILPSIRTMLGVHLSPSIYPSWTGAATIFLNPHPHRDIFLRRWIKEIEKDPEGRGLETTPQEALRVGMCGVTLGRTIRKMGLQVTSLPESYTHVYDYAKDWDGGPSPNVDALPVIEQYQYSRIYWGKK